MDINFSQTQISDDEEESMKSFDISKTQLVIPDIKFNPKTFKFINSQYEPYPISISTEDINSDLYITSKPPNDNQLHNLNIGLKRYTINFNIMINEQFYKMLKLTKYSFSLRWDITFEFEPPINCDNAKVRATKIYFKIPGAKIRIALWIYESKSKYYLNITSITWKNANKMESEVQQFKICSNIEAQKQRNYQCYRIIKGKDFELNEEDKEFN